MATLWQSATSDWLEDDDTGAFELVAHRGLGARVAGMLPQQQRDAARWLGAALPLTCDCSAVYPPDFAFCPQCGAALQGAPDPAGPDSARWLGPFADQTLPEHIARGMALSACSLATRMAGLPPVARPDLSLPAPPAAPCLFSVAASVLPLRVCWHGHGDRMCCNTGTLLRQTGNCWAPQPLRNTVI